MSKREITVLTDAALITCVVQRGFADPIIKAAQEAGAQGATVYFGRGTGVRERLGRVGVTRTRDAQGRPQRSVPLRLRQALQELPREEQLGRSPTRWAAPPSSSAARVTGAPIRCRCPVPSPTCSTKASR